MTGIDADDELGGCRSSAIVEVIKNGGRTHGVGLLEHLRDELELLQASSGPTGHRRVTGNELQRRSSSGSDETRARGGDRRGDLRGKDRMLTGSAVVVLVCSGTAWRGRMSAAIFGDPRKKTIAAR